tara:strand:- start:5485 stop:5772 length:288 start_codon:yes stop_codon:yes gene_type:complete
MLKLLIVGLVSYFVIESFALDKVPAQDADSRLAHIEMHKKMMAAHQQAAECLKSGKQEEDCREIFQKMCLEANGHRKCGPWMMNQMNKKDVKKKK